MQEEKQGRQGEVVLAGGFPLALGSRRCNASAGYD